MSRRMMIAGNWKMNNTIGQAVVLTQEISNAYEDTWQDIDVVVCPPYVDLKPALTVFDFDNSKVFVGAQNCHWEPSGAYTGEISIPMLSEMGVTHCIVGHSERREYFAETNQMVAQKVRSLVEAKLTALVCVGESLHVREEGTALDYVCKQLRASLAGIDALDMERVVIAYEPIWAIGTGRTASPAQAQEVCAAIREELARLFGEEVAKNTRILYGGSMNPANVSELLGQEDIDGGLIGGAALKCKDFVALIDAALERTKA